MKARPHDSLTEALALLRRGVLSEGRAAPASSDIGELFLAELRARRERLERWIRLLHEEATARTVRAPAGNLRHRCKGPASALHARREPLHAAERQLIA